MVKLCFCIPLNGVKVIAGRNCENLKNMSADSNTVISIQSEYDAPLGSNQRIILIDGESENVVNALRIIIPRLVDRKSSSTETESIEFVKWLIPDSDCGFLIGKKGMFIRNISTLSGAHVRVVPIHECKDYHPGERFEIARSYHHSLCQLQAGSY
jgi:hypothetical protein